jgi:hypothetical protein
MPEIANSENRLRERIIFFIRRFKFKGSTIGFQIYQNHAIHNKRAHF